MDFAAVKLAVGPVLIALVGTVALFVPSPGGGDPSVWLDAPATGQVLAPGAVRLLAHASGPSPSAHLALVVDGTPGPAVPTSGTQRLVSAQLDWTATEGQHLLAVLDDTGVRSAAVVVRVSRVSGASADLPAATPSASAAAAPTSLSPTSTTPTDTLTPATTTSATGSATTSPTKPPATFTASTTAPKPPTSTPPPTSPTRTTPTRTTTPPPAYIRFEALNQPYTGCNATSTAIRIFGTNVTSATVTLTGMFYGFTVTGPAQFDGQAWVAKFPLRGAWLVAPRGVVDQYRMTGTLTGPGGTIPFDTLSSVNISGVKC